MCVFSLPHFVQRLLTSLHLKPTIAPPNKRSSASMNPSATSSNTGESATTTLPPTPSNPPPPLSHADVPIRTTLLLPGHIRTPLFASIAPTSRLANFVFPVQNPHDVAKKVISALETEQSREIYVPRIGGWVGLVKGMPSWVVDWVISVRLFWLHWRWEC